MAATNGTAKHEVDYVIQNAMSGEFGGFTRLWAETVEWALQGAGSRSEWKSHHFRRWWLRAALARGHAQWLVKERVVARTQGHTKPIEKWRLQPPGRVVFYEQDCAIYAVLVLTRPRPGDPDGFPAYDDDDFNTSYNIAQMEARAIQSNAYGWTFYSYTYGAPVS